MLLNGKSNHDFFYPKSAVYKNNNVLFLEADKLPRIDLAQNLTASLSKAFTPKLNSEEFNIYYTADKMNKITMDLKLKTDSKLLIESVKIEPINLKSFLVDVGVTELMPIEVKEDTKENQPSDSNDKWECIIL